ncbi:uncharacterized protein KNAG_0E00820 [Huiozyma naganishii CBS 8797]|uniref:Amino acid permease/ SLC12A domain-containing protein n=1 Tax=Huiozyma naganishii (strain ATCC MYA-139 / BCRC 22969 / CBS 8797 / KCTC 17520 / NBRC 10181 / NCYC 3082 / Yp74L-3) TaxID=1071383 RepID=J7R667_HUIN7|nr:hypothetical protein KNAG_0E00820 [Kazachstania naganishii CBS 8797]CCK70350.1 hypothetical protein KNAG_0E00820 [Kazachstania naganishii CBS 8797]
MSIDKKDDNFVVIEPAVSISEGHSDDLYNLASRVRTVRSHTGAGEVNYINSVQSVSDNQLLAEIGYKPELKRQFSTLQVFGIAFSIMGLLPSIASVMAGGLAGGPVSLVWGWFSSCIGILIVGITMAENASAIPTAGGMYYWTYYYAPKKYKAVLSFVVGCSNSLALVASCCSINYGFAEEVMAAVFLTYDGAVTVTSGKLYGIFAGATVVMAMCTCVASGAIARLQTVSIVSNIFIIILFVIAVPIGTKANIGHFNDGKYIFGHFENLSDWNNGFLFFLAGFMPAAWTISSFDSCVHQSEEAKDAKKSVPIGIIGSITACWILGFLIIICLCACMDTDLDRLVNSDTGFAMAQIIFDSLGKRWAIAFMALIAFCQFLMGASIVTAISRQIWAFARDDGLPFSNLIKYVDKRYQVPFNSVIAAAITSLLLGLLCLINSQATAALFSLSVAGGYIAYLIPTVLRLTVGRDVFRPGPFYLGKFWSPIVAWSSVVFEIWIILLEMFPAQQHHIDKSTMNYSCVIGPGTCLLAWIYYRVWKHREYIGPKSNLSDEDYKEALGPAVLDDIIMGMEP